MEYQTKSVIVANDIVGLGKVALSTALPVLTACQLEAIPLPTVLLSSHTGGFDNISRTQLKAAMRGFLDQWQRMDFQIDGLITGYFGSQEQLDWLTEFADQKQISRFVDPIMGDKGRLYAGYQADFVTAMRGFCRGADVITPNITEACLLAGCDYLGEHYSKKDVEQLLAGLSRLENKHIIVTGVAFEKGKIGLVHFDRKKGSISYHMAKSYPYHFFGTGDLLTAVLGAGYFHGLPLDAVASLALDFIDKTLQHTLMLQRDLKMGLYYEPYLVDLASQMSDLRRKENGASDNTSVSGT
ncbi:pyridoxamine kinase [Streptococcus acidominimus]|uniref:pyridoxal kinase n=1 Tax=Streptococcus acidominimus TaxID=1326 RepID=A0A4Y9FQ99_STRAI|nr:pyridoxamine kinase [Streptococcus acidominimus]MBF0847208.1 pyridoxamine kinase [Streptococcus danieliae]MBF0818340.1 pyridoxamine kinase [Streptococcus acidominimus]MBF0838861.1 pyridoxamine kinase [Streptococcus acidominimus]MBF0839507.1 pyridoxamine kinase [Streptococcus acidominimus]TFU31405.1 pyridoxamine kinase [Streptococcus acidominimus]